jgi:two-component system LytT family sensor kinase
MMCVALDYQNDLKDREIRTADLERSLSEARLATLRTQLDPHFLFNTLNSISAYVESAPRQARLMIEQLGDLLRLSLEHADEQEIALERELLFVDRYIQLQLVRYADRLDVRVRVDPEVTSAAVPNFLLQPLLENGIRHGTSKLTAAGTIEVSAWRSGERLHLRVRDNGPGLPAGWTLERHIGIGLSNTQARLEQLYGKGEYSLEVAPDDERRGTCVDVTFPYRQV